MRARRFHRAIATRWPWPSVPSSTVSALTDDPWRGLAVPRGRALGVRRRPRRHRRAAARPRACAVPRPTRPAESLLRGAHASAVLEGSASTLDEVREGGGDEIGARPRSGSRPSCSAWRRCWPRSPLQALARLHALAAAGTLPDEQLGRPRDAEAADRLRGARPTADRADRGAGAGGRRGGARRARRPRRRSPRTTGSSPAPPSGWCWSPAASTRSRWSCPRPGTWRCGAAYESNLRGYRDGGAGRRARLAALRRARPTPRAPRRARCDACRRPLSERSHVGRGHASGTRLRRIRGAAADT